MESTIERTRTLHQYATAYAEAGYPVFPLKPEGKKPATENGFYDATTDIDQINKWWQKIRGTTSGCLLVRLAALWL